MEWVSPWPCQASKHALLWVPSCLKSLCLGALNGWPVCYCCILACVPAGSFDDMEMLGGKHLEGELPLFST